MHRLPTAVLLLAIAAVFWPALGGDYVYDDTLLIAKNAAVVQFDLGALLTAPLFGADVPYWRPLTSLTFAIGHHLGGPTGIHTIALLLHAANTLLVFGLARRWLAATPAAFGAALLFAVHPVQAEAVAWCAAVNDPLWVFWALLAIRCARQRPWGAAACCLLALLSKENALAALPLLWLLARAEHLGERSRALPVALAAALLVWLLLRALVFGEAGAGLLRGPAPPPLTLADALTPFDLLTQHLQLLLFPVGLTVFHEHGGVSLGRALIGACVAALAIAACFRTFSRQPVWLRVGGPLLLLPLLPTLLHWRAIGAHPVGERYLYLCVAGFAVLLLGAAQRLGRHGPRLALPLAIACGIGAHLQAHTWHDQAQLVARGLAASPDAPKVNVMAGQLALQAAQAGDARALAAARGHYAKAEQLATARGAAANRQLAEARLGLAWCLLIEQGSHGRAAGAMLVEAFQRAVDTDRDNAAAWVGLGVAHGMHEDTAAAEQAFRQGLQLDPRNSEGWCNLGFLQLRTGRRDEARSSLERALVCDPGNARAAQLLGQIAR